MRLAFHKTKILCTVGPAIGTEEKIRQILKSGGDAFRLNFSHGSHEDHAESIDIIRRVEKKLGWPVAIVADIQGPKIRVGDLPGDGVVSLINGREIQLAHEAHWKKLGKPESIIPIRYPNFGRDARNGGTVLFDDGLLKVKILESDGDVVRALVVNGGLLKSRKGINLPNVHVSHPSLTPKDKRDIEFAVKHGVDYIAISFVRTAKDVVAARNLVKKHGGMLGLIAKIEKPEALTNIDSIIDVSDAVMIARGDLGVEIPAAQVPTVQKRIIRLCNDKAVPVITATQMLESMVHNHRPTRAEASDVANAVMDGTDAVMLSAETSVGAYPAEAVAYMRRICNEAEKQIALVARPLRPQNEHFQHLDTLTNSMAKAVAAISGEMPISGIASQTKSGRTVRFISHHRPNIPIISITQEQSVARLVTLYWGVMGLVLADFGSTDEAVESIKSELVRQGYFQSGSHVVITIGRPLHKQARTNMISVETLP